MSSDTYTIQVLEVKGTKAEFLCTTGTAGGLNDCSITRSFALMIIEDGMPYTSDGNGTPLQRELTRLAGRYPAPVWEADFHKAHVAKFIAKATLVKRIGIITDIPAWQHGRFELENEDDYPLHSFILHVEVTDPKWLEGIKQDYGYGTTAFDAWAMDPKRQSRKELAIIEREATKWVPPKEGAAKKPEPEPVKKAIAKKTAAKKAPAKKPTTKKTARKKSA